MSDRSAAIIEPGHRGFLVWCRIQAIRWKIRAKYRPRFNRTSNAAEKDLIRTEMEEEVRRALKAEGLQQVKRDPHSLYLNR